MNIAYYPFNPIKTHAKKVTVIDLGNVQVYWDFVQGLSENTDTIKTSTDEFEKKDPHQLCTMYGDLLTLDLNKIFGHKIAKLVLAEMTQSDQVQLIDAIQKIQGYLLGNVFMFDLPLLLEMPAISDIIKMLGLKLAPEEIRLPYDKLETLIKILIELDCDQVPIITNASHFLNKEKIDSFSAFLATTELSCVLIEFSENKRDVLFENTDYYYVDSDFVLWHEND